MQLRLLLLYMGIGLFFWNSVVRVLSCSLKVALVAVTSFGEGLKCRRGVGARLWLGKICCATLFTQLHPSY
jgi:hypothetical protein